MELSSFYVYFMLAFLIYAGDGAKILGIFPFAALSHFTCNNAIMKNLIDAGHEVTVITPFPKQASAHNYTSIIDVSKNKRIFISESPIHEVVNRNSFRILSFFVEIEHSYCTEVLNLPEIQRILKSNEKLYDVVFVEIFLLYKCYLHVAEKMKIPVIGTVTLRTWLPADFAFYNTNHPAYTSFELTTQKWHSDNILGRITNVWNYAVMKWHKNFVFPKLYRKFHDDHADELGSLSKYLDMEPDLVFYNNHPSLLPRPMNPNTVEIGGIHTKDNKPLPKDIEKFIDEADRGVLLFSLGSIVRAATLPTKSLEAFIDAFAEIPQRVIWKFEEKMENISRNVLVRDWLPQRDILEHKNVIAFISHCGLGSVNEAVYTATPLVACPLFVDQLDNAKLLEDKEVAVHLDIYDITKENVLNALNAIINDTKYYNNMQKLSKQFKDRPITPQQNIVYWTEYVIKHNGAAHLKSPATRVSWYQYLMLDVLFVVTCILIILIYSVNRAVKIFASSFKYVRFSSSIFSTSKNKKL